jgi:hypothetical protein
MAMRNVAPNGHGTVKYLGKSRMKALPRSGATGQRSAGVHAPLRVPHWFKGPKVGSTMAKSTGPAPLVTTPTVVRLNVGGTRNAQSACGCSPPDPNGAINATRIVEAVNLSMTIYQRNGALVKRQSLASFFPTSRPISDPRIQFDNRAKRWILTFIPIPETTTTTPQMFVAVSTTAGPAGSWFKYTVSFSGGPFVPGTLLDYPMLGQDTNAIILGTNNFQRTPTGGFTYTGSSAFAFPKAALYSGGGFSFPAFNVAFGTHPAVAQGKPMAIYPRAYLVAANSAGGYSVYFMTNTAGTPTFTFQGNTAGGLWSPPPSATQPAPNAGVHLDTLDGRLSAEPIQDGSFLWFTHTVALGGFPAIRYGAISQSTLGVTSNNAFATATSNDWNPSIALAQLAGSADRIFLSWATNDPAAGQNVSLRVSGVGPNEGVPSLAGVGTTLFTGTGSTSQTRFGDYSSTSMDVKNVSTTCKANTQALVVNQVFNAGDWQARLARVGTC